MHKFLPFLASALIACTCHAAPPSDESIDELLAVTKSEKLVDSMLANVDQMMRQSMYAALDGQEFTAEQRQVLDRASAKFANVVRGELAWANMRPTYLKIYKESFDQEEIDGLIAFYKSPTGAAFVAKMPIVMQKSMGYTQQRLKPMMEKMNAAIQEAIKEAQAAGRKAGG